MGIKYVQQLLLFLLLPACSLATDYYFSNSGNDNNSGTTAATPWRTIDKLNNSFYLLQPGDHIFFRRGDKFIGTIRVTVSGRQGQPVSFGAYGTGSDPVISGFASIKGWVKKEKNTWQAAAPFLRSNLILVTMDAAPQQIGRYPNADERDAGYLRYENFIDNNIIIDSNFDQPHNWSGAEIVIRKNHWTAERCRVLKQEGQQITFTYANRGINL
jgi:hypothetical protein